MYLYKKIKLEPFPVTIHSYVGTDGCIIDVIRKEHNIDMLVYNTSMKGFCQTAENSVDIVIYASSFKYILHETIHAISEFLIFLHLSETDLGDEVRAYYTDYVYGILKNKNNYTKQDNNCL